MSDFSALTRANVGHLGWHVTIDLDDGGKATETFSSPEAAYAYLLGTLQHAEWSTDIMFAALCDVMHRGALNGFHVGSRPGHQYADISATYVPA